MAIKKAETLKKIEDFYKLDQNIINKLEKFVEILLIHNQNYNLIGKSTIEDIWNRHILDSAQLIKFIKNKESARIIDFGSGAGLPAIILSVMGVGEIHLVEKSFRKCEFLEIAKEISDNKIIIHQEFIDKVTDNEGFDYITSRAFAPLDKLIKNSKAFVKSNSIAIFPKGKNLQKELDKIKNKSKLNYEIHASLTSNEGNILLIHF